MTIPSRHVPAAWHLDLLLISVGLIPALVLWGFVSFDGDRWVVSGVVIGSHLHGGSVAAAQASLFAPLLLLLPPVFSLLRRSAGWKFWISVLAAPACLLGPAILAVIAKGCPHDPSIWVTWIWLGLLLVNLTLWFQVGLVVLSRSLCLGAWGLVWVFQGFFQRIADYLLPNVDLGGWEWLVHATWVLPPIGAGIQAVDGLTQRGQVIDGTTLSWLLQIALLSGLRMWHLRRKGGVSGGPDTSNQDPPTP